MRTKLFLLLSVFALFPGEIFPDEYSIDQVSINATINEGGTITYTEQRTYTFDGVFSWASYTLPNNGFTELTDISVSDQSGSYVREYTENPGTFNITTNAREINLKWYYEAQDETKEFTIRYTLHGALAIGPEWSEFYWNYISDRWKEPTREAQIDIKIPDFIAEDSLFAWLHTQTNSANIKKTTDGILIAVWDLGDDENLICRLLFPTGSLGDVSVNSPNLTLSQVKAEEKQYTANQAAKQAREACYSSIGFYLTILIALLSLIIWFYLFRRNGTRFKIQGIPEHVLAPPTDHKPAIIGWLMQGQAVNGSHLIATIFDLSRRGFFIIHQEEGDQKRFGKKEPRFRIEHNNEMPAVNRGNLTEWEESLYMFIADSMTDTGSVYLHRLTDQRSAIRKWFPDWARAVKKEAKARDWVDRRSKRSALLNSILQTLLFAAGILTIIWTGPAGLIGATAAFICGILSLAIIRRTREGETVYRKWKSLKQSIKNVPEQQFERNIIDRLFIYAISLGISNKHIEKWLQGVKAAPADIAWIAFLPAITNPSAVAASLNTLVGTGLQSVSSVGGGTGATAGSAGGGAGGAAG